MQQRPSEIEMTANVSSVRNELRSQVPIRIVIIVALITPSTTTKWYVPGTYHLVVVLGVMSATMITILIGTCERSSFLTEETLAVISISEGRCCTFPLVFKSIQKFRQPCLPSFPCPTMLTDGTNCSASSSPSVFGTGSCHGCSLYRTLMENPHV